MNLKTVRAWCSGKGYNRPNKAWIDYGEKRIEIYDSGVCLACFAFKFKKEFWMATKIVIEAMKKS